MREGRKYEGPVVCLDLDWTKKDVLLCAKTIVRPESQFSWG